jgi:hypothetical protein
MTLNRSLIFLVAAVVCFVIALLLATSVINGSSQDDWLIGGLLAFALAHLP